MSSQRSSGFPWGGPVPQRKMTPQPMPSWIAPRRASMQIPAVNPSMRPPAAPQVDEPPPPSIDPTGTFRLRDALG